MINHVKCPCCSSKAITKLSVVSADEIITLYQRNNIDVKEQFLATSSVLYLQCDNCDLKFFSPAIAGNENFYNQLQELDWYFLHPDKTEFYYSKDLVVENNKVLDVGSGRGAWASYLKEIPGVFYQGIEFSTKSIHLADKDGVNVIKESIQDHAKKNPFSYDVTVAFQVLEHIDNIKEFISACLNSTKPGGKLIIAVPNNDGFLKSMTNNWLNIPPHHINHWNERSLRELGKQFNLGVSSIYKEKITNVHKLLFYTIKVSSLIHKMLGIKKKLVDISLRFRIINKISFWIAKLIIPFSKAHKKNDGHTIIVVFEKIAFN